jgi:hypothetical protein
MVGSTGIEPATPTVSRKGLPRTRYFWITKWQAIDMELAKSDRFEDELWEAGWRLK